MQQYFRITTIISTSEKNKRQQTRPPLHNLETLHTDKQANFSKLLIPVEEEQLTKAVQLPHSFSSISSCLGFVSSHRHLLDVFSAAADWARLHSPVKGADRVGITAKVFTHAALATDVLAAGLIETLPPAGRL